MDAGCMQVSDSGCFGLKQVEKILQAMRMFLGCTFLQQWVSILESWSPYDVTPSIRLSDIVVLSSHLYMAGSIFSKNQSNDSNDLSQNLMYINIHAKLVSVPSKTGSNLTIPVGTYGNASSASPSETYMQSGRRIQSPYTGRIILLFIRRTINRLEPESQGLG